MNENGLESVSPARTITEADLVGFATLTGDHHPQHTDAEWARNSRFGGRVAHGMLVLSYAVGLAEFDPERVVALRGVDDVTFKRPVRIGDTIRVTSRVESVKPLDEHHTLITLAWRVLNQEDQLVIRARVQALYRNASAAEANGEAGVERVDDELHALYGERVCL